EKKEALACCLRRQDETSTRAGLLLAEELADEDALRELHQRMGEFCFAREDWATALEHFHCAGNALRVSQCHEPLGRPLERLRTRPLDEQERLLAPVGPCEKAILERSERREYLEAVRDLSAVLEVLEKAESPVPALVSCRDAVRRHRLALIRSARASFEEQRQSVPAGESRGFFLFWSAFEEAVGDRVRAAQLAEEAGDFYRASLLWESDEQYGEALRALGRDGDRQEVLALMAELAERGGDLAKAASLYEQCRRFEDACRVHTANGRFDDAAR